MFLLVSSGSFVSIIGANSVSSDPDDLPRDCRHQPKMTLDSIMEKSEAGQLVGFLKEIEQGLNMGPL